jgi:hypothetical protein
VNSSQSTRVGALLVSNAVVARRLGEDATLANDNDVLGELLLELANQTSLDTVGVTEETEGNKENDGLLTSADIDLLGRSEVPVLELVLKLSSRVGLQLKNLLGNGVLEGGGLALSLLLLNLGTMSEHVFPITNEQYDVSIHEIQRNINEIGRAKGNKEI